MKHMVVDTANLLFRVAAAHGKYHSGSEDTAGLAMHIALNSLQKFYKQFKPDQIALTFEGTNNWRKEYTKSDKCLSKKVYKANRVKDASMEPFFELIGAFKDLVQSHSSLICLSDSVLEGDDLFAGYVQKYTALGHEVIGVSGDKDFVQLLKHKNFTLINPDKGKPRTLLDVCGVDDAEFFMFEKAMRGDKNDNVFPAYPRVQKKRLLKCLSDEYELTKIMNETWSFTDPDTNEKVEYTVGDLFKENMLLMDLESQPEAIRKRIVEVVDEAAETTGKFNLFYFTKFCGKFGLKQIAENATNFANMFSMLPQQSDTNKTKKKMLLEIDD